MESNAKPLWMSLLKTAVTAAGKAGKQRVADRLGFSRPYVSRVMNPDGKSGIPNPPQSFIDRVIDRYHVVSECPATQREQPRIECRRLALGAAPMHNPLAMRIWKTCQTCPHKPEGGRK